MAARNSGMPVPSRAEVSNNSGKAAARRAIAASTSALRRSRSAAPT